MSLNFEDVREILRIIDQTSTSELHIEVGDFKLVVGKHGNKPSSMVTSASETETRVPLPSVSDAAQQSETSVVPSIDAPPSETAVAVRSPLAGTFYRAPAPGADPFVKIGDVVDKGATVCILDVMKVMNMLSAPCHGQVLAITVENAEAVSGGQPLIWFEPK